MTRHLIDHAKTDDGVRRTRAFIAIDRADRPSWATLFLQRRPAATTAPLRQFISIARGRTA